MENDKKRGKLSASFITGAIALSFLLVGYQTALFLHRAATLKVLADREHPDTVYVLDSAIASRLLTSGNSPAVRRTEGGMATLRREARHEGPVRQERLRQTEKEIKRRGCESFRFDPNTVSIEDLVRLGFSPRQAAAIDNYRASGGRFRRKEDFAKSFVVADSVYARLESFIDIPKIDLNRADSAAFDTLPGIGGWFAAKMVAYREQLGGYSYPEQLMDIWHFDAEKFDGLKDLITLSPPQPYPLWTLPEEELKKHPYIGRAAHGIVLFRTWQPVEKWTVEALLQEGILGEEDAARLGRCSLAAP